MRYWCLAVLLGCPSLVFADLPVAVRPADAMADTILVGAMERSAIVRSLVRRLESTEVIVHVETSLQLPGGMSGATRFVTSRGGYRFLRVTLSARLLNDESTIMLGHELQHATEIAEAPVHDIVAIERLLKSTGYRTGSNVFETASARRTEKMIRLELSAAHRTAGTAAPASDASAARSAALDK